MNSHKNARLTYQGRRILVFCMIHEGLPVWEAAKAQGVSPRTAHNWLLRYLEKGKPVFLTEAPGQDEAQGAPLSRCENGS